MDTNIQAIVDYLNSEPRVAHGLYGSKNPYLKEDSYKTLLAVYALKHVKRDLSKPITSLQNYKLITRWFHQYNPDLLGSASIILFEHLKNVINKFEVENNILFSHHDKIEICNLEFNVKANDSITPKPIYFSKETPLYYYTHELTFKSESPIKISTHIINLSAVNLFLDVLTDTGNKEFMSYIDTHLLTTSDNKSKIKELMLEEIQDRLVLNDLNINSIKVVAWLNNFNIKDDNVFKVFELMDLDKLTYSTIKTYLNTHTNINISPIPLPSVDINYE